jgi:hypothetical protein
MDCATMLQKLSGPNRSWFLQGGLLIWVAIGGNSTFPTEGFPSSVLWLFVFRIL